MAPCYGILSGATKLPTRTKFLTGQREIEANLIARARQGDRQALSALYEANVQNIYRYVFYRVSSEAVAEDITSETFLKAIEGLGTYEDRGVPFVAWLYRIAYARIADYYRRGKRQPEPMNVADFASDSDVVERAAIKQMRIDRLVALLPKLTGDQQHVIILRIIEGYSIEETASMINKTQGAVKALQHRALRSLARVYYDEYGAIE